MGDTNMDKTDDLVDCNEVDPITGIVSNAPNKGDEEYPSEDDDWAFDDEQKERLPQPCAPRLLGCAPHDFP